MRGQTDVCGCFPTGRHYPGIAEHIAKAIQSVPGLCVEHPAAARFTDLPFVVIDFETTGRDPATDRVLEVGLVAFDRGAVRFRESLLVDPEVSVPEEARAVHGITDEELAGAPKFHEVLPRLAELLEGRVPVAYNADFDRGFLHAEVARARAAGSPVLGDDADAWPPAIRLDVVWIDPLVWAREILRDLKSRRLGDVCAHFGIPLEQAHRAAGDAEATGRVLLALSERMPTMYGELVRLQSRYAAFQSAELAAWKSQR